MPRRRAFGALLLKLKLFFRCTTEIYGRGKYGAWPRLELELVYCASSFALARALSLCARSSPASSLCNLCLCLLCPLPRCVKLVLLYAAYRSGGTNSRCVPTASKSVASLQRLICSACFARLSLPAPWCLRSNRKRGLSQTKYVCQTIGILYRNGNKLT